MTTKPRILRVITRLNIGGPAIHVKLLASGLSDAYETLLVFGSLDNGEGDSGEDLDALGIRHSFIPELVRPVHLKKDWITFLKLRKIIQSFKPDIIHTHTSKAGFLTRLAAISVPGKKPVLVHTYHGHTFHSYFGGVSARLFLKLEQLLAKVTQHLIVLSENQLDEIHTQFKVGKKEQFSIVPLGFNLDPFLKANADLGKQFRRNFHIPEDVFLIGIVGRMVEVKDHTLFLEAFAAFKKAYTQPVIGILAGNGPLFDKLQEQAKNLGIQDSLVFTSWVKNLVPFYQACDLVALTSLNEGTPVSLIEAMASGRPVVSTNVGGISDFITHNQTGILCSSRNPEEIAALFSALADSAPQREKMGVAARLDVKSKFSKERLFSDLISVYNAKN